MKKINKLFGTLLLGLFIFGSVGLTAQGKGKAKKEAKMAMKEERKAKAKAWKEELEAIKADETLTNEEKELLIEEKKAAKKAEKKARREALKAERHAWKAGRDSIKAIVTAIEEDPRLTDEEKEARIKEIKEGYKATRPNRASGSKGKGKNGKAKRTAGSEKAKGTHTLSKKQKSRALEGLDRAEKRLIGLYEDGKITDDIYTKRLSKIKEVREKLEE